MIAACAPACIFLLLSIDRDRAFRNDQKVGDWQHGTHDTHLYTGNSLVVRKLRDRAAGTHAEYLHCVADVEIRSLVVRGLFLRLGRACFLVILDLVTQAAPLLLHGTHVGFVRITAPFVVITDCLIGRLLRFFDDIPRFFPCFLQDFRFLRIEVFFLFLQGFLQGFDFLLISFNCFLILFHGAFAFFKIRE